MLASIRKCKKMWSKNCLSFSIPILTPPPSPPPQPQINFDRQEKGDVLNNCLMTVNGTDFPVPKKRMATKENAFASHKYAGKSALRYELGVRILGGTWCGSRVPTPQVSAQISTYLKKFCIIFWTRGGAS